MLQEDLKVIRAIQDIDLRLMRSIQIKYKNTQKLKEDLLTQQEFELALKKTEEEITRIEENIEKCTKAIKNAEQESINITNELDRTKSTAAHALLNDQLKKMHQNVRNNEAELEKLLGDLGQFQRSLEAAKPSYEMQKLGNETYAKQIEKTAAQLDVEIADLTAQRKALKEKADPQILKIYERLLRNKRQAVIVPVQNRFCTGCYISITAQLENFVKTGKKLAFCENCNLILFWEEESVSADEGGRRRRGRKKEVTI